MRARIYKNANNEKRLMLEFETPEERAWFKTVNRLELLGTGWDILPIDDDDDDVDDEELSVLTDKTFALETIECEEY